MKDERVNWEGIDAPHEGETDVFSPHRLHPSSLIPPPLSPEVEAFDRTRPKKRARRAARNEKSLVEYIEEFLAQARLERGSSRPEPYAKDLRQYVAWLQGKGIASPREINSELVRQFAHDLRAGQLRSTRDAKIYAPSTIAAKLYAVRAWHKFLAREYRIDDPTVRVPEMRQAPMREVTAYLRAGFKKAHPRA